SWSDRQADPGRCSAPAVRQRARLAARAALPHPARRSAAGVRRQHEAVPRERCPLTLSKLGVRDRAWAVLKAFELQLAWGTPGGPALEVARVTVQGAASPWTGRRPVAQAVPRGRALLREDRAASAGLPGLPAWRRLRGQPWPDPRAGRIFDSPCAGGS